MGGLILEFADIQKLMTEFEKSSARELKIDDHDFHLYLSKNKRSTVVDEKEPAKAENNTSANIAPTNNETTIKAPLVGTVYLQPKPGEPAYVKAGDQVKKGDVVCVIEAMKMLTEVKSDFNGVVKAINVENGDLVEFNQPLLTITEA